VNWTPDEKKGASTKRPGAPPPPTDKQQPNKSQSSNSSSSAPKIFNLKQNKSSQWEKNWSDRVWRTGQVTMILGFILVGYGLGAGYIQLPYGMNYRASSLPKPGSAEEALQLKRIETTLNGLPIVQELSQNKDFIKTIGIFPITKEDLSHHLTGGTLAGLGRITVKPITFYNSKTKEFVVVMHIGQDICGHRGLVHGGFLATILDECLGKTVFFFCQCN
jgi:hypothetical protein